jgi:hypothetical protein
MPVVLGALVVVGAVTLAVVVRKHAPPEPARLLPGGDGFLYVNLKWIRRLDFSGQLPQVAHDPEYEQFIQATGFQFERDLEQAALAIHYGVPDPQNPAAAAQTRYSKIFVGRIDGQKLRAYLRGLASGVEADGSVDIYNIPLEGRTLRVAIISPDTVAASNYPDPQVIRGIILRARKLAWPFGGPPLLRRYYKQVPLGSLAWGIFKVEPATARPSSALDFSMLFSQPAVVVASARYLRALHLRAEAFTGSPQQAQHAAEQMGTFLNLFHSAESTVGMPSGDPDVKAFFDSLKIEHHSDRAVLTATLSPGFIRKAIAETPKELPPPAPKPSGK